MPRENIDPVEIEVATGDGTGASTYVFDISEHMIRGEVCTGIALALGEALGRSPERMTPLSSVVDCDALQLLFHTRRYGDLRDDVSVSFPYDIYTVTVEAGGQVVLQAQE
ncbi:HalOD1 output domain-containing protein [Halorussus halophilus]|uniref:HalOD1 output domain-containing protein n=1 Tax=Halorussus halophilus TaxID=2650975 RepID=UPI001301694A|nr:HalOD1 output domain-containing protein [Halorussus halophilus]